MNNRTCTIDGCTRPIHCHGLCNPHYRRQRRGTSMDTPIRAYTPRTTSCEIPNCQRTHYALGLCRPHYLAEWAGRNPLDYQPRPPRIPG